jgi:hypothetical protein
MSCRLSAHLLLKPLYSDFFGKYSIQAKKISQLSSKIKSKFKNHDFMILTQALKKIIDLF